MHPLLCWPLAVAVAVLVVAAVLQHRLGRIPNQFTYGSIAAAWAAALILVGNGLAPAAGGGIGSSAACTAFALVALLPMYALGLLPPGCIKTQMAFAAWVGCGMDFNHAMSVIIIATLGGAAVTAIGVTLYQLRQAAVAKPEDAPIDFTKAPDLFPLQTTLSLGSIAGVLAMFVMAVVRLGN